MMVPLLLFAYGGLFTFFDAFRTVNLNTRASYTIADLLSREQRQAPFEFEYFGGLNSGLSLLTQSDYATILRVTQVERVNETGEMAVVWSEVAGGTGEYIQPIVNATYSEIEDIVPIMAGADKNYVIETWSGFVPMMRWVGVEPQYFGHSVVTRARFGPSACYETGGEMYCHESDDWP